MPIVAFRRNVAGSGVGSIRQDGRVTPLSPGPSRLACLAMRVSFRDDEGKPARVANSPTMALSFAGTVPGQGETGRREEGVGVDLTLGRVGLRSGDTCWYTRNCPEALAESVSAESHSLRHRKGRGLNALGLFLCLQLFPHATRFVLWLTSTKAA